MNRDDPSVPAWVDAARRQWTYTGAERPPFAIPPGPGQESVWDYPRPPAIAPDGRRIEVIGADGVTATTARSVRVLETSLPPSFYVPPDAIAAEALTPTAQRSHCEWKGEAEYLATRSGEVVGWRYPAPYDLFADYAGWVSFYPDRVECRVDGERARPQPGGFYGGWVTEDLAGPFKGEPGSWGW